MIKVYVEYGLVIKKTSEEEYHYKYFEVSGHADNVGGLRGVKCCAGISACLLGFDRLLCRGENYSYRLEKGNFFLKQTEETAPDRELNSYMNLLLCQLFEIYQIYPEKFSSFITKRIYTKKGKEIEWHQ